MTTLQDLALDHFQIELQAMRVIFVVVGHGEISEGRVASRSDALAVAKGP